VTPGATLAKEFAQSHGKKVEEIMSTDVVSATEDTPLSEIASLLEKHRALLPSFQLTCGPARRRMALIGSA
jgi:CBS domain-containing protein